MIKPRSTPVDAAQGTPSLLAILETAAVMAAIAALVQWRGLQFLVIPACIALVFLMRTDASTQLTLTVTRWGGLKIDRVVGWGTKPDIEAALLSRNFLFVAAYMLFFAPLCIVLVRVAGFFGGLVRNPIGSVVSIPGNWWRISFATDFLVPPEILPTVELSRDPEWTRFRLAEMIGGVTRHAQTLRRRRNIFAAGLVWAVVTLALVGTYAPALLYRWSVKASTWIWFPLVWSIWWSSPRGANLEERLDGILNGRRERFLQWYSLFAIVVLTILPFVIAVQAYPLVTTLGRYIPVPFTDYWLFTGTIEAWHVGRCVNAIITIALLYIVEPMSRRLRFRGTIPRTRVARSISVLLFIRYLVGLYLAAKLLQVFVESVPWATIDWRLDIW